MVVLGVGLLLAGLILFLFGLMINNEWLTFIFELIGAPTATFFFVLGGILMVAGIALIIFGFKKKADANKKSE